MLTSRGTEPVAQSGGRRPRLKRRDDRDFDTTSLRANAAGISLSRDYSAHFFRWSFARRYIKTTDQVLEVGCGVERPLFKILCTSTGGKLVNRYLGVDLGSIETRTLASAEFIGNFDFTKRWPELRKRPGFRPEGFDVAVNMEVLEHMLVAHGTKMLKGIHALLRPGGTLLLSTPCYDGVRHAANHIHEYTVPELSALVRKVGFRVERRFGTFMDLKHLGKAPISAPISEVSPQFQERFSEHVRAVAKALGDYYDKNALSCIFAPLYPDHARNNLWVLRKL